MPPARDSLASIRPLLAAAVLALLAAACAHQGEFTRGADTDRLLNAIVSDDVAYVRAAVRSGGLSVNQRIPAPVYMEGAPLITLAARAGALEVLRFLISAGANINALTPAGETALMLAAYFEGTSDSAHRRHEAAVRMLVEAGASIENEPYHYTPLAYAAYQGHDRIVRYLIERGARVDADAENGYTYVNTPLMMAAIQGHHNIARSLLAAGADPAIRVHHGHTAAEFAHKYNHQRLFHMLRCAERMAGRQMAAQACDR
jgi:hypothetical protein